MINLNEQFEKVEQTIEPRYKVFIDTKNKTTRGRLKVVDNNVFINLSNVLTAPKRFVTEEEQKANMALWIIVKDDELVEDLWMLQRSYKLGYKRIKFKCNMLILLWIITTVFFSTWIIFKLFP